MFWGLPVMVSIKLVVAVVTRKRRQGRGLTTVWRPQRFTITLEKISTTELCMTTS